MIHVAVADRQTLMKLDRPRLRRIVRIVLSGEGITDADISLAFVDNAVIERLNAEYLGHEGPTDVITFPLSGPNDDSLSGEIVISTEYARAAAKKFGHSARDELALYVIHGLLHLCDYDDRRALDRRRMREREGYYLKKMKIRLRFSDASQKR